MDKHRQLQAHNANTAGPEDGITLQVTERLQSRQHKHRPYARNSFGTADSRSKQLDILQAPYMCWLRHQHLLAGCHSACVGLHCCRPIHHAYHTE